MKFKIAHHRKHLAAVIISGLALAVASILALESSLGCATPAPRAPAPAPILPTIAALRNTTLQLVVTYNLTYTPRNWTGVQDEFVPMVLNQLSADSTTNGDGNSFVIANGVAPNLTLTYTIYNNNERYSGNVQFTAWQGWNWNINSGEYTYSNGPDLVRALTDKVYNYLHTGWHDPRGGSQ